MDKTTVESHQYLTQNRVYEERVWFSKFQKKFHVRRTCGRSINCWSSCRSNVGSDVSIVIDRFSPPGKRASAGWHWHTVVFFHLLWNAPARVRFFYANCSSCLYLMKIDWPSRVISSHSCEGFFESRRPALVLIAFFIFRAVLRLDQIVDLGRGKVSNTKFRKIY